MIAQIEFQVDKEHCLMLRAEAVKLNLAFEEITTLAIAPNGKLCDLLNSYNKIQGETCFQSQLDNGDTAWYDSSGDKVPSWNVYKPAPAAALEKDYVRYAQEQLVDLLVFAPLCPLSYVIKKTVKPANDVSNLSYMLAIIEKKLERLREITASFDSQFNTKCDVHVGGGLIATFNEVKLLEDSCTDILQTELANGWRLIACCVQPDQRRPDYILGRYNTNLLSKLDAKR